MTGTTGSPGRGSPRADAVLTALDEGVPLLFIEVDNGTEGPAVLAEKIAAYRRFGRRTTKDTNGREVPLWQTMFPGPAGEGLPPLALVFTRPMGEDAMWARRQQVADLSASCWRPRWISPGGYIGSPPPEERDGYFDYTDTLPVLATTVASLRETGPHGPIWWRFARKRLQTLERALDNSQDRRAYEERETERRRRAEAERQEQERRREAQRQRAMLRREAQALLEERAERVEELALMWDNPHRIDLGE